MVDLGAMHLLEYFDGIPLTEDIFLQDTLNNFISDGKKTWRQARNRINEVFDIGNNSLQNSKDHKSIILFSLDEIEMQLPVQIGDYTDFYSSKEHATNVGSMFRDQENALMPNWLHFPVDEAEGYIFGMVLFNDWSDRDIQLEVDITTEKGVSTTISKSNFKYMYWTMA